MIGLMDSGSGGISVLDACRAALPDRHFVYFGDHANAPYGNRSPDEIMSLTKAAITRLFRAGCKLVLIACNTAAAVALRPLQQSWLADHYPDHRVLGVHVPLIEALTGTQWAHPQVRTHADPRTIAVFATPATIRCQAFETEIAQRSHGLSILGQACPGLAEAVEAGAPAEQIQAMIAGFWDQLHQSPDADKVDSAVLACTHYPLIADAFRAVLPPSIQILTQPAIVAGSLIGYLARNPHLSRRREPLLDLRTSGDPDLIARTPWLPPAYRHFQPA